MIWVKVKGEAVFSAQHVMGIGGNLAAILYHIISSWMWKQSPALLMLMAKGAFSTLSRSIGQAALFWVPLCTFLLRNHCNQRPKACWEFDTGQTGIVQLGIPLWNAGNEAVNLMVIFLCVLNLSSLPFSSYEASMCFLFHLSFQWITLWWALHLGFILF